VHPEGLTSGSPKLEGMVSKRSLSGSIQASSHLLVIAGSAVSDNRVESGGHICEERFFAIART